MKNNHISDLIPAYLDGILDENTLKKVEEHLSQCPNCQKELEEMKTLFKAFDDDVPHIPTDRLRNKFEEALHAEKENHEKVVSLGPKKKSNWATNLLKVAASIALLVASFQMGSLFQQKKVDGDIIALKDETLQMKQTAMLSLMENQSASKRIQGVNYIVEFEHPDEAIIQALANRLLHDENDNVRLTAFEALSKFSASDTVKNVFIEALGKEKNPSIQIGIIERLVQIQEKKAIAPMKKLLEQEDTQPFIKEQIKAVLPRIT
ncbi:MULTISPECIES: HEAT repeat domain-containing protein [Flavobacteriaceae]|uniref:HEAT repeat domain-containing protein n=1 Tax=Flavobacteriaceae TaxID=49546 RepID=UPI00234B520B|nr:HEAT repeat domain-containing protein [Muricauda sp. SP22]MDC6361866.1 HEAT repeat domain-containing protein [Muricauda sp. SP22]